MSIAPWGLEPDLNRNESFSPRDFKSDPGFTEQDSMALDRRNSDDSKTRVCASVLVGFVRLGTVTGTVSIRKSAGWVLWVYFF